jgi:hypothetical protein
MDAVRAKFACGATGTTSAGDTVVKMHAVYSTDPDGENRAFTDATPNGTFQITIAAGKPAAAFFEVGREYYLDITQAG